MLIKPLAIRYQKTLLFSYVPLFSYVEFYLQGENLPTVDDDEVVRKTITSKRYQKRFKYIFRYLLPLLCNYMATQASLPVIAGCRWLRNIFLVDYCIVMDHCPTRENFPQNVNKSAKTNSKSFVKCKKQNICYKTLKVRKERKLLFRSNVTIYKKKFINLA